MYFSFLLWASTSAAIQPGLSSSNVLCFIAIVAIVSFEQINHCICQIADEAATALVKLCGRTYATVAVPCGAFIFRNCLKFSVLGPHAPLQHLRSEIWRREVANFQPIAAT